MRESMAQLTPRFSADRTVREYTEQHYMPAAKIFLDRAANNGEKGKFIADSILSLQQKWNSIRFGEVKVATNDNLLHFEVQVYFNDVNPDNVLVELFSNGLNGGVQIIQNMNRGVNLEGQSNAYSFNATVAADRSASDFTPRALPLIPTVEVPLEISNITWQH
jgi:starch phosphorylase